MGLVVSDVGYKDGDRWRSILYEGSLSEMIVPYMDPSEGWFVRTFLDIGEWRDGFSSSLEPGADCPENAVYFDQIYANPTGSPWLKPRAACLFEQPAGAWQVIAENLVAVDHDHLFSFRLDFDVDGTANSFVRDKLRVQRLPADSVRKSLWVAESETAKTEE